MNDPHCSHYTNPIFLKCHAHTINKHLHCGSCGMYLKHSIQLTRAITNDTPGKNVTIHSYRRLCINLKIEK